MKRIMHHDQERFISGVQGWFTIHKSSKTIYHVNRIKDKNYMCKVSAFNAGDMGSIPGSGRAPGEGNDNPL